MKFLKTYFSCYLYWLRENCRMRKMCGIQRQHFLLLKLQNSARIFNILSFVLSWVWCTQSRESFTCTILSSSYPCLNWSGFHWHIISWQNEIEKSTEEQKWPMTKHRNIFTNTPTSTPFLQLILGVSETNQWGGGVEQMENTRQSSGTIPSVGLLP